jgi:hypothetical protein
MRWLLLSFVFLTLSTHHALAFGALMCSNDNGAWYCAISYNDATSDAATEDAMKLCSETNHNCVLRLQYSNECAAAAAGPTTRIIWADHFPTLNDANRLVDACNRRDGNCHLAIARCDVPPNAFTRPIIFVQSNPLTTALFSTFGIILVLVLFASRAYIINFVVHGNMPQKIPVYAEDVQVLFKRTQRLNWYGRVVFGIIARLSMDHKQFSLVRRYWLGRVIAFDSFRRQRQNELATLHLQLAAKAKSDPHDKKKFWSRRWATFRSLVKKLFWAFVALFNLIIGLFFIRVTIAKLARGKLIESKDISLILQARDAIEDSAKYLKEYLITAETFDGREEMFEPE